MPESMSKLFSNWSDASPLTKGVVTMVAIALAAGAFILFRPGTGETDYSVAFSKLELTDAGEIVALLDDQRVPYELEDDGTTILVPSDQVHRIRLSIAAEGLPKGSSVGFEIMDNLKLGATEFERRVNYVRALQGELVRTITQLSQVEDARVHIALPEPSVFVQDRTPATAAVFLRLAPGGQLTPDEVRGIKHLVASSIENLVPEDVTVVDTSGQILASSQDGPDTTGANPEANLGIQQAFENRLQQNVQTLLEQVFGPGEVVVRVNAELNFDQKVVERDLLEPVTTTEGLVSSLRQLDETFVGSGNDAAMPSGSDANIPGYQSSTETDTSSNYSHTEVEKEYQFDKIHEQLVVAPGTVDRLSVAVMVNGELTPAEQNAISEVVAAAIGADASRSDQISVMGMAFDNTLSEQVQNLFDDEEPVPTDATPSDSLLDQPLVRYGAAGAAGLLLLLVVIMVMGRRRRGKAKPARAAVAEVAVSDGDNSDLSNIAEQLSKLGNGNGSGTKTSIELKRLASQHPEQVARVLRTWLDASGT